MIMVVVTVVITIVVGIVVVVIRLLYVTRKNIINLVKNNNEFFNVIQKLN